MKKYLIFALLLFFSSGLLTGREAEMPETGGINAWVAANFAKGVVPPFSFDYDVVNSDCFIGGWQFRKESVPSDEPGVEKFKFTYTGRREGVRAECLLDIIPEYDALRWTVYITNISATDSKNVSALRALNASLHYSNDGECRLHYLEGSHISKADYHPRTEVLQEGGNVQFVPAGGRSSQEQFPYYNLELPDGNGVVVAVGWTGTWISEFEKTGNSVKMQAGMKTFDSYLHPGETVRTPLVGLVFWEGDDRMAGHNKFRRFSLAHHTRMKDGRFVEYPFSCSFNHRDPYPCQEYSCLTEEMAVAVVERYTQFGFSPEVFWLDAGWFTGAADYQHGKSWANTVGNWSVDKGKFPRGLKPVSDAVHRAGAKFLLWFEPERVMKGTDWAVKHPEWLLEIEGSTDETYRLFDMSNPEARAWMTSEIAGLMRENGVDYYRQDFNMEPDKYWEQNDEPGRRGMKEMRYIEGEYAFLDTLMQIFPDMLIDNCASGGRRLDFEMQKRSAPLWRSDYYHYDDPDGYQGHTVGLNFFLPLHGTGVLTDDPYSFRCGMSSALILNWRVTSKYNNVLRMRKNVEEYLAIRPYYYEDYYPLCQLDDLTADDIWVAYQMHRPSDDTGVIVAFRRPGAPEDTYTVKLCGLDPEKEYTVTSFDFEGESHFTGAELAAGYTLEIAEPRGSLIIQYR
ncbi:MAG: alpha-galactosidase [Bacteroidales bacterium]|nr:alpha-galactosidase [Candidatus Equibacterium intestinale]